MAYNATLTDPGAIQAAMKANSDAYATADHATQQTLHADNLSYAAKTGQTYNSQAGTYSAPTPSTNVAYPTALKTPITSGPVVPPASPTTAPAGGSTFPDSNKVQPAGQNPFTQLVPGFGPAATATSTAPTPAPVTVPNPNGQSDGSLHLNVNGTAGADVPVFKGTSFESGSDLAKQLGLDYKADPTTGEITIGGTKVMPTSYDKQGNAMVGVRQVANALGYQIGYDDKSKTITVTGKPTTTGGDDGSGTVNEGWKAPDMSGMQGNMMPYGTFNGDMNTYYNQAHAQLDAQYQQQKQALLDKQQTDISASDESMNKRGIYSSGVAQSVEDDLRTKTTQAVANVLSNQMAAVAKTAQSLYDTAYKQYQDGNTFALKNNQDNITNMLAFEKQSFNEYIATHKLTDAETNAANAEFDKQAALIQKETQAELPYNNVKADTIANNQTKENIAALPYQQMTIYQQATTEEKAKMDAAVNYFKQNAQTETANHNATTEAETNRHNKATEAHATQIATQNDLKAKNANLFNIWKASGKAPAGIDGITEGTPFLHASSATKIDPKESYIESESIKSQLNASFTKDNKSIDNAKAKSFIDANMDVLTDSDYRDLQAWVDSTFKK